MGKKTNYPNVINPSKVGTYPALVKSGGGYFYDEVLEYRVWVHPTEENGSDGSDYFYAFGTYYEARNFSEKTKGAEVPLVLVLQKEYIDEVEPGRFVHMKQKRLTEWRVEWLEESKRLPESIPEFLKKHMG